MATRAPTYRPRTTVSELRNAPRQRVTMTRPNLRTGTSTVVEALLHDLSIYGCRLETGGDHAAGDRVMLAMGGAESIPAMVMWHDDGRVGCRFDKPIARTLMRAMTLRLV